MVSHGNATLNAEWIEKAWTALQPHKKLLGQQFDEMEFCCLKKKKEKENRQ